MVRHFLHISLIFSFRLFQVAHCLASDSEKERGSLRIQQHTIWSKHNQRDIAENRQCPRRSGVSWQPPFCRAHVFDCLVQWCVPKNCWLSFQKSNSTCKSNELFSILYLFATEKCKIYHILCDFHSQRHRNRRFLCNFAIAFYKECKRHIAQTSSLESAPRQRKRANLTSKEYAL